jgi:hypothetical protein
MKTGWCRDYRGITNSTCQCGVQFAQIRVAREGKPSEQYPCFGKAQGCEFYNGYTQEEVDEDEKKYEKMMTCLRGGVSWCCNEPVDESQIITEGTHKGHGRRYCSKCGQLLYMV